MSAQQLSLAPPARGGHKPKLTSSDGGLAWSPAELRRRGGLACLPASDKREVRGPAGARLPRSVRLWVRLAPERGSALFRNVEGGAVRRLGVGSGVELAKAGAE